MHQDPSARAHPKEAHLSTLELVTSLAMLSLPFFVVYETVSTKLFVVYAVLSSWDIWPTVGKTVLSTVRGQQARMKSSVPKYLPMVLPNAVTVPACYNATIGKPGPIKIVNED